MLAGSTFPHHKPLHKHQTSIAFCKPYKSFCRSHTERTTKPKKSTALLKQLDYMLPRDVFDTPTGLFAMLFSNVLKTSRTTEGGMFSILRGLYDHLPRVSTTLGPTLLELQQVPVNGLLVQGTRTDIS